MPEPVTMGEITRWLQAVERRMGEMHAENRAGLVKIESSVVEIARLQRDQNGRVAALETRASVIETRQSTVEDRQRTTEEEMDEIQGAATRAATQAIHETAPTQKRATTVTAVAAGITGGGIIGVWTVVKMIVEMMK